MECISSVTTALAVEGRNLVSAHFRLADAFLLQMLKMQFTLINAILNYASFVVCFFF